MTSYLRSASLLAALSLTGCVAGGSFHAGATAGGPPPGDGVVLVPGGEPDGAPAVGSRGIGSPGGGVAPASGMKLDDFAFALKEYTGSYSPAFVAQKLTTFEVAPACFAKMTANDSNALHAASFYTRAVMEYAKKVTGDDWAKIETQNNNDRERNKLLVAPMVDAFGQRFHLTIALEGDDCVVEQNALWLRYWTTIGDAFNDYPPPSGTAFIKLNVTPSARDVTVTVDPSGSQFTITAPRDIEPAAWDEKIEKPFRRLANK